MRTYYRLLPFGSASLASLTALVLANAAAQTPLPTLVVTATNAGTTVEAVLNQPISVQLRGNATTPYSWYFVGTNGSSVVTNGPSVYVADSPALPGSPGTFEFPFLAADAGITGLSFAEHLIGNPQDVLATFDVTIEVTVPQPVLSIVLVGNEMQLTWPDTTSADFLLEGTSSLYPARWAASNVIIQDDGTNYSGAPPRFRNCAVLPTASVIPLGGGSVSP